MSEREARPEAFIVLSAARPCKSRSSRTGLGARRREPRRDSTDWRLDGLACQMGNPPTPFLVPRQPLLALDHRTYTYHCPEQVGWRPDVGCCSPGAWRAALRKFRPIASACATLWETLARKARGAELALVFYDGHCIRSMPLTSANAFLGVTLIGRPCGVRLRASGVSPVGQSPAAALVASSPAKTSQEYLP